MLSFASNDWTFDPLMRVCNRSAGTSRKAPTRSLRNDVISEVFMGGPEFSGWPYRPGERRMHRTRNPPSRKDRVASNVARLAIRHSARPEAHARANHMHY